MDILILQIKKIAFNCILIFGWNIMTNYFDGVDGNIMKYFRILAGWEIPARLIEYVNTKEVLRQQYISLTCGTIYSDLFNFKIFYSNLNHSIWVALIIRNFTHDKKQTLSYYFMI